MRNLSALTAIQLTQTACLGLLVLGVYEGCLGSGGNVTPSNTSDAHIGGDGAEADTASESADQLKAASMDVSVGSDTAAAADADAADALPESTDAPGGTETSGCPNKPSKSFPAVSARSSGFSGPDSAFYALFGGACGMAGDCVPACVAAGGTMASCMQGSACLTHEASDGGLGCSPPVYWVTVAGAVSESGTTAQAAQVVLIASAYDDSLVLTNFGVSIPSDAVVTGIQFQVRRATLAGNATDDTVQVIQNGLPVGTNHGEGGSWPAVSGSALSAVPYSPYGGANDLWGVSWSIADLQAPNFGLSIAPKYTGPAAGNEFAYIDSVRVTVFYTTPCD